jgi:hypothetical protein
MPTAFKATVGSGSPTRRFLRVRRPPWYWPRLRPDLIAISGLATGLALKAALGEGNGTVLVLSSPAEEGGGGKIRMMERGALQGLTRP